MLNAWFLGSIFFLFIFCVILYVFTLNVENPEITKQKHPIAAAPPIKRRFWSNERHAFAGRYRVEFSPRAFVDYPFGIRVVLAEADASNSFIDKPAERTGHRRSNVYRRLQESEYIRWPDSALQDPEMIVMGGSIAFEPDRPEPCIRVEVKTAGDAIKVLKTAEDRVVRQGEETAFSLWLHPLKAGSNSLTIVISRAEETGTAASALDGKNYSELAKIALAVSVGAFPIVLR